MRFICLAFILFAFTANAQVIINTDKSTNYAPLLADDFIALLDCGGNACTDKYLNSTNFGYKSKPRIIPGDGWWYGRYVIYTEDCAHNELYFYSMQIADVTTHKITLETTYYALHYQVLQSFKDAGFILTETGESSETYTKSGISVRSVLYKSSVCNKLVDSYDLKISKDIK